MKLFPDSAKRALSATNCDLCPKVHKRFLWIIPAMALGLTLAAWHASAAMPRWMQDVVSGTAIEAALYRMMELPAAKILYPRPPKEAQRELSNLIGKSSAQAELYSLRANEEEQALDFNAAEADWKAYASKSSDPARAKLELANYYHRRLQSSKEAATLFEIGSEPAQQNATNLRLAPAEQQSWQAFERLLSLIHDQALDPSLTLKAYDAWIARYPRQPSLYARELNWLLDEKNFNVASSLVERYRSAFPHDSVFPIKAAALIEYRRGSAASDQKALAIYDAGFEPLWPTELIQSYYDLLKETHAVHGVLAIARAQLATNPDDLKAMARLFYYAQQQGNLASAQQAVDAYRQSKEQRNAPWSAQELYTLATMMESTHSYAEAARYNYALYHSSGQLSNKGSPQAEGLSGMIRILLNVPDQPLQLGVNNLSMYRDIATLDQGPGYWNGILSLWFNSTNPQDEFHQEEVQAQPYFYRAKASELLALLDRTQPQAAQRAGLHVELLRATAEYGESSAVVSEGTRFLSDFGAPSDEPNRVQIASMIADAYAQQQNTPAEFAIYDRILIELSTATHGMPLTSATPSSQSAEATDIAVTSEAGGVDSSGQAAVPTIPSTVKPTTRAAFEIAIAPPADESASNAPEYANGYKQTLDRYLGRLTATGHLPQALEVLRRELDRNPNDPLLYEKLATFLAQNNLSAQQEEVFEKASRKFQDESWYSKLARLYLREKKREAFADLTRKVTGVFQGTELEHYFSITTQGGPQLFLELNLFAHRRFPHDQVFVQNLLQAYTAKATKDPVAWEALMREHWSDSEQLQSEFFNYLSLSGKLESELKSLQQLVPHEQEQLANPAASRELADALLWQSHYEESAPLLTVLETSYPADEVIGDKAASVFRSLAYYQPSDQDQAIQIEKQLLTANPSSTERLATIGDIYSDSTADGSAGSTSASADGRDQLALAADYWRRIPQVHPGSPDGYVQSATIFWDYFRFDEALQQINQARVTSHQSALYGYEAGAIDEGKHDFNAAVHEYIAAATMPDELQADSPAVRRVLKLAGRPTTARIVDEESLRTLTGRQSVAAIDLRARVLEVQKRSAEIAPLLGQSLSKASKIEEAEAIATQAEARNLTLVFEEALQRETALATDPVQKIDLTYQLAASYESRNDLTSATKLIETEYNDNPKLLGVVRATTDFYWKHERPSKAIETLVDASHSAAAPLKNKLLVEAAIKSNESGNYDRARALITPLLTGPGSSEEAGSTDFHPEYLAIIADSYGYAGDRVGLKQFYLAQLTSMRSGNPPISGELLKQRIVLLRRSLIPALTRLKDYAGTVSQYVEILNAYPEDSGTIDEAALYALHYGLQQQLITATSNTAQASPKDSRFAIMLAQIQTTFGNDAEALEAYSQAVAIRSDRSDLYIAKADLEERLQRFDEACQDYQRLYKLSYQNPDWMVKIATARARQGRSDEAVKALEQAWLTGRPKSASRYFQVATQLESWAMLNEAMHYAELGVKDAGNDLLAGTAPGNESGDDPSGAATYLRIATRLRQHSSALAVLDEALKEASLSPNSPTILAQQVEKQGVASVTDEDWRKQRATLRKTTAQQRYLTAILQMAVTAGSYFTPEEKEQFARFVDDRWKLLHNGAADAQEPDIWIEVAASAGLAQQEASMRQQVLLDRTSRKAANAQYGPFVALERARMQYSELATTLGSYAKLAGVGQRQAALIEEAQAFRSAGDELSEIRALHNMNLRGDEKATLRERYLQLLLTHDVSAFENYSANNKSGADALAAPNYAAAHSGWKIAEASLAPHTTAYGKLWKDAYTSLLGLYFRDASPESSTQTEAAFHRMLGDSRSIGERLQQSPTNNMSGSEIRGSTWFYYGMRFGAYQNEASADPQTPKARDPEQLLAAGLENSPGAASTYVELAQEYEDEGKPATAIEEYKHALELAADSPSVHDQMAQLLWKSGQHDEAIEHWRSAIAALDRIQNRGPAPESFWTNFISISKNLKSRKLTASLHGELDALLRNYIARNGNYRSDELLEAIYLASEPSTGVTWLLSLSDAAAEPADVLASIDTALWIPVREREPILLREYQLAKTKASQSDTGNTLTSDRLFEIKKRLILYYVALSEDSKAQAILISLSANKQANELLRPAEIELAVRSGKLKELLASWRASYTQDGSMPQVSSIRPEAMPVKPSLSVIRTVANKLSSRKDTANALTLWRFVFDVSEANNDLLPSDSIGLAEAELEANDAGNLDEARNLLRRMILSRGDVYSNSDLAASLLEKLDRPGEAVEFLSVLAKSVPWNSSYKVRLAQAKLASKHDGSGAIRELLAVADDTSNSYDQRSQAALALAHYPNETQGNRASAGSNELALLIKGKITPQQSQQPYFIAARLAAATSLPSGTEQESLLREALAIDPKNTFNSATRLKLFKVEESLKHTNTALAAIEPLIDPSSRSSGEDQSMGSQSPDSGDSADTQTAVDFSAYVKDDMLGNSFETPFDLEAQAPLPEEIEHRDADRLALSLQLANVYEANDQKQQALAYLKLALYLDQDPNTRVPIGRRVTELNRSIAVEAHNSERRPLIQPGLEQSVVVRPMLSNSVQLREVTP